MKTIAVAQVGCGYWGPNLLRTFSGLRGVELKALCDKKPGRLAWARGKYPGLATTADYRDLLGDPGIDAIVVATEVVTHRSLAAAALRAGKHVFVEKPLAHSTREAQELAALAKARRRTLAVGHVYLFHPAIEALRAELKSGRLGRPQYLDLTRVNPGPPAPKHDVIWDLAPHEVSLALDLAGARAVAVRARGLRWTLKVDEAAFLEIRFAGGGFARVHVSWRSHKKIRTCDVYASKGSAFFNETAAEPLTIVYPGLDNRIGAGKGFSGTFSYGAGRVVSPKLAKGYPLDRECADFIAAIRGRRAPYSDGTSGVNVVRVLESAARSAASGGKEIQL